MKQAFEIKDNTTFWDILRYVQENRMCMEPGCTTCGCMEYRTFLKQFSREELAAAINRVTLAEIAAQDNLDWHDAFEILMVDHDDELFRDSVLLHEYHFVFEAYKRHRRMGEKPWEARQSVIQMLKNKERSLREQENDR